MKNILNYHVMSNNWCQSLIKSFIHRYGCESVKKSKYRWLVSEDNFS